MQLTNTMYDDSVISHNSSLCINSQSENEKSLNKNVNLKGTVTGNSNTLSINFANGEYKLPLSKFNLKKGKSYKFNFKCSNANYQVSQTIVITIKK